MNLSIFVYEASPETCQTEVLVRPQTIRIEMN